MSNARNKLPDGQDWIINPMTHFNYNVIGGVCNPVVLIAIAEIFSHNLDEFYSYMSLLSSYQVPNKLAQDIHDANAAINAGLQLTVIQRYLLKIEMIFKVINGYYNTKSNVLTTETLVANILGSTVKPLQAGSFVYLYSAEILHDFFQTFRHCIIDDDNLSEPLACVINSEDHTIGVSYDHIEDCWILISPNKLSDSQIRDTEELSRKILSGFLKEKIVCLNISIYSSEKELTRIQTIFKQTEFKTMLTNRGNIILKQLSTITTQHAFTWLCRTIHLGNAHLTASLLIKLNVMQRKELPIALYLAIFHKQYSIVNLLLSQGVNPNIRTAGIILPLNTAVKNNDEKSVSLLLHYGAKSYLTDANNQSAFEIANVRKNLAILTALKKSLQNDFFNAAKKGNYKVLSRIINHDHDMLRNVIGHTAFYITVHNQHEKSAQVLLEAGVSPNQYIGDSVLPLHTAIRNNDTNMVTLLLKHGAKVYLKNVHGKNALDNITQYTKSEIVQILNQHAQHSALWKDLLKAVRCAKINTVNAILKMPLDTTSDIASYILKEAMQNGRNDIYKVLLIAGFKPRIVDEQMNFTFQYASEHHHSVFSSIHDQTCSFKKCSR